MQANQQKKIFALMVSVVFAVCLFGAFNFSYAAAAPTPEQQRCDDFFKQFNIKSDNSGFRPQNGETGNVVESVPRICTASELIMRAINIMFALSGSIAILFIILGGFWLVTSAGNEETAEKGRKVLTNSIIGLIVIVMSFAIVRIVVNFLQSDVSKSSTSSSASSGSASNGGNNFIDTNGSQTSEQGKTPTTANAQELGRIIDLIIPDKVDTNTATLAVYAKVNEGDLDAFKQACLGKAPGEAKIYLEMNKKKVGTSNNFIYKTSQDGSSSYQADVSAGKVTAQSLKDLGIDTNSPTVGINVCGVTIKEQAVTFTTITPRGAGGYSEEAFNTALSAISFTSKWDKNTVNTDSKTLYVNITKSSGSDIFASQNNIDVICDGAEDQKTRLFLDGKEVYSQPNTVMQFTVTKIPKDTVPQFGVSVCGIDIDDGSQPQ